MIEEGEMKWAIEKKATLGFGLALAILAINVAVSYRNTIKLIENDKLVTHTQRVLKELEGILASVNNVQAGQRGYVVTGEENFLAPYRAASAQIDEQIKHCRALTADNPNQQRRILMLEQQAANYLAFNKEIIALRREQGFEATRQVIASSRGEQLRNEIHAQVAEMQNEENELLQGRMAQSATSARVTTLTFAIATLFSVALLGVVYHLTRRYLIERRLAEESLQQTATELARSNKELEEFAYVASHDLQEPLRMVVSYMQLLQRRYQGKLDANADEFIAFAVDGANRMQTLINDLLTYSRVGTRGKPFAPTDCTAAIKRVLSNLRMAIEEQQAVITQAALPTVMADDVQIMQLFQNLIGNAIKFHGEAPPRVQISAKREATHWLFSVRDHGIGIDPEYAERIFKVFQRLHGKAEYPGTGIGLAVCKKIVERHGGRIWVESQAGQGATFYFTIPATGGIPT